MFFLFFMVNCFGVCKLCCNLQMLYPVIDENSINLKLWRMKKLLFLLSFVFVAASVATSYRVPFRDTDSQLGRIIEVRSNSPLNGFKVVFEKGTETTFPIEYEALSPLSGNIDIRWLLLELKFPFLWKVNPSLPYR